MTPQTLNRYAYARNNPLRYTDPAGQCVGIAAGADTLLCAVGGAAAAVTAPAWLAPVAIGVGIIALSAGIAYVASAVVEQQGETDAPDEGGDRTDGTPIGDDQATIPAIVPAHPQQPPLPDDPAQPPAPGWVWRGKGPPGSAQGSWYNPRTGESLHPDLQHPAPVGPHWDYKDPSGTTWRVFPDGRMEPKKRSTRQP